MASASRQVEAYANASAEATLSLERVQDRDGRDVIG